MWGTRSSSGFRLLNGEGFDMRSLQDWTRYLEQQEQDLQTTPSAPKPKEEKPATPPIPAVPTPKPEDVETPAFLRAQRPEPSAEVSTPAPAKPAAPKADAPAKPAPKKSVPRPKPAPAQSDAADPIVKAVNMRKRLPASLNVEGIGEREVARSSYKSFKESREELIQRLIDPILTLEEVARILNVCPTTVRRYTNRGVIAHQRTAGNQRRFRLSDVLAFLEQQSRTTQE